MTLIPKSSFLSRFIENPFLLNVDSDSIPERQDTINGSGPTREKDVALAVGKGMNNKRIANDLGISERTVKTHLTRVFEKFHVKDRVALAIILTEMH
jgi:DNA-binding NarL/FixJ family response regulator